MTNVPEQVRNLWTEVYTLFDLNYNIDIHNADDWKTFHKESERIYCKYGKNKGVLALLTATGDLLAECHRTQN
jgi:hypothetical protein